MLTTDNYLEMALFPLPRRGYRGLSLLDRLKNLLQSGRVIFQDLIQFLQKVIGDVSRLNAD